MRMASPYPTYRSFKKHAAVPALGSKNMKERNCLAFQTGHALLSPSLSSPTTVA
ncbi:unnamed protein product [Ectocarpus sp. 4 AP-2014]